MMTIFQPTYIVLYCTSDICFIKPWVIIWFVMFNKPSFRFDYLLHNVRKFPSHLLFYEYGLPLVSFLRSIINDCKTTRLYQTCLLDDVQVVQDEITLKLKYLTLLYLILNTLDLFWNTVMIHISVALYFTAHVQTMYVR